MTFEQRPEGGGSVSSVNIWRKNISERGKAQWWEEQACYRYRKKASGSGTERGRGENNRRASQRDDKETRHIESEHIFSK